MLGLAGLAACGSPAHLEPQHLSEDDYYLGALRLAADSGVVPTLPVYSTKVDVPDFEAVLDRASRALGDDYMALGIEGFGIYEGGWRCARAPDPKRCQSTFDAIRSSLVMDPRNRQLAHTHPWSFLVSERKGSFRVASTPEEIKRALGAVDSLPMAGLHARLDGYAPWLPAPQPTASTGQAMGADWQLIARTPHFREGKRSDCTWDMHELVITRTGSIRVIRTLTVLEGGECRPDRIPLD